MKLVKSILVCFLIGLMALQSTAEPRSKRVRSIEGRCEITRDISLAQAEARALEDAKLNALRAAGVPEKLWSVSGLITEDDGSEFSQVLSKMTTLEVNGFVNVLKSSSSKVVIDSRDWAVVTIDAEVKRGGEVDPTFVLTTSNIQSIYDHNSEMTFNVRIYGHDAYLRIFWFDNKGGSMVFPSNDEADRLFKKDFDYTFPVNPAISYIMEKSDRTVAYETINFLAVATKRNIPFTEKEITFETVLKWIYSIPADERAACREAIVIR